MNRILLVENNRAQRQLYREELEDEGYEVVPVMNGREALRSLGDSLFDLIVLDVLPPKMDALKVLGKIVSRYRATPVIVHTAFPQFRNEPISWLADACLVKSSDLTPFKRTVKQLLKRRS